MLMHSLEYAICLTDTCLLLLRKYMINSFITWINHPWKYQITKRCTILLQTSRGHYPHTSIPLTLEARCCVSRNINGSFWYVRHFRKYHFIYLSPKLCKGGKINHTAQVFSQYSLSTILCCLPLRLNNLLPLYLPSFVPCDVHLYSRISYCLFPNSIMWPNDNNVMYP